MERYLGGTVLVSPSAGDISIEARVARSGERRYKATVGGTRRDGTSLGTRELVSSTTDCRSLDDGLVLIVALMIDPTAIDAVVVTGPATRVEGGSISPGLYELTSMRVYFAGAETGTMRVRETMRVRGSAKSGAIERLTEAKDASGSFEPYPLHAETMTYETGAGPAIFTTAECPERGFVRNRWFDATTDTLTLQEPDTNIERVYRRIE